MIKTKFKVLFVCKGNCCRSQIAEGLAKSMAENLIEIFSAGSKPTGFVKPEAITVMREIGIDISKQRSKSFAHIPPEKFDMIVTMGCGDVCPHIPARKKIEWEITDPTGESLETYRNVRDQIQKEILKMLKDSEIVLQA